MERYKVIKEFGIARKGDIFDKVQLDDEVVYVMESDESYEAMGINSSAYRGMTLGEEDMEVRIKSGYIQAFDEPLDEEEDEEVSENLLQNRINRTINTIDNMINTYKEDHNKIENDFKEGKVQPCVKVEADTVYFNMIKVLKEIKKTLLTED